MQSWTISELEGPESFREVKEPEIKAHERKKRPKIEQYDFLSVLNKEPIQQELFTCI